MARYIKDNGELIPTDHLTITGGGQVTPYYLRFHLGNNASNQVCTLRIDNGDYWTFVGGDYAQYEIGDIVSAPAPLYIKIPVYEKFVIDINDYFGDTWFMWKYPNEPESAYRQLQSGVDFIVDSDIDIKGDLGTCLLKGTLITMLGGAKKPIEEIRKGDVLLNGEIVTHCDTMFKKSARQYDIWTFENGYSVKTAHRHRFYNCDRKAFVYLDEWEIGESALCENGSKVKLLTHEHRNSKCQHYTLFTTNNHYYANGLLSGNRFSKELKE